MTDAQGIPNAKQPSLPLGWRILLTAPSLVIGGVLAAPLAVIFSVAALGHAWVRAGWRAGLAALVNLPWDLLVNCCGWWQCLGTWPLYYGTLEQPGAGWIRGALCFRGGAMGHLVSSFAHALTLSSVFFISGRAWAQRSPAARDELVNHELWHVHHHLLRYTFLWFWPAYLYANVRYGIHRRNPWETGPLGPYTWVTDRWADYGKSDEYVDGSRPFWF